MGALATKSLTDEQTKLARHYAETGDVTASAAHAGLSLAHSYVLLRQPQILAAVHQESRRKIVASAPIALKFMVDLVKDEKAPHKLRLDAAWRLTQMAGHVAPRAAVEKPADTPLHEMSTDQLRELAGRLEDEIAGRARTVSSAELAPPEAQAIDVIG